MFRPAVVMPFYNHEHALEHSLAALKRHGLRCWLVDDGSDDAVQPQLTELARCEADWLKVLRLSPNQGKGAAVMAGCAAAAAAGHSHVIQVDADGQHDLADLPRMLVLARARPNALVTGVPLYDATVPKARLYGRYITHFWVWIHTLSLGVRDSMCGYRVYPLAPTLAVWFEERVGRRMDFDTDILVRLYWRGTPIIELPTRVIYPADGVSHFKMLADNLRISGMHTRLFFGMVWRLPRLLRLKLTGVNP